MYLASYRTSWEHQQVVLLVTVEIQTSYPTGTYEISVIPLLTANTFFLLVMFFSFVCGGFSYLSRFDLVNWKALVEHPFATELDQKVHISFVLMIFCNVSIILLGFILL